MTIWFGFLLVGLFSNAVANRSRDCNHKDLDDCLGSIREIASDPSIHFAANEDILNDVCKKVDQGLECAFNYTARCFSKRQKEIHRKSLSGAVQVIGDLCTPGAFRQSFLKYAPCLREASIGDNRCSAYYYRLMEHTERQLLTADNVTDRLRTSCCEFVACSTNRMADICGEDAAEFVARYTRRVAGTLIHRHCTEFLEGARCSSAVERPACGLSSISGLMGVVVFSKFLSN